MFSISCLPSLDEDPLNGVVSFVFTRSKCYALMNTLTEPQEHYHDPPHALRGDINQRLQKYAKLTIWACQAK